MGDASDTAAYRHKIGIGQDRQVPRRSGPGPPPDPGRGGSRGYSEEYRRLVLSLEAAGLPFPAKNLRSMYRWKKRLTPCRMTGNKATQKMNGEARLLLVLYKKIWPEAQHDEVIAFIADSSRGNIVYSRSDISNALGDLDMTRKRASTTAHQAFTPRTLRRVADFWSRPHPLGIVGTPRRAMIDCDEFGLAWDDANRNFGHNLKGLEVRKIGKYGRGEVKVTVIIAIEPGNPQLAPGVPGSVQQPRIWCRTYPGKNTTTERYRDFLCDIVIGSFGPDEPMRTILHDNLNAHKSDAVVDGVYMRRHRITCRPPYNPHCAPVEFAINQIACMVRDNCFAINGVGDLVNKVQAYSRRVSGIDALFAKCRYPP